MACAKNGDTLQQTIELFRSDWSAADDLVCSTFDVDKDWLQTYRQLLAEHLIDLCIQEAREAVDIEAAFSAVDEDDNGKETKH